MVKETTAQGDKMRVCEHGEPDSNHAVSYYRVLDTRGRALSWLEMEPYTGRTHQLRVHAAYMDHPIIGDSKYFFLTIIGNYLAAFKIVFIFMRAVFVFLILQEAYWIL